MRKTKRKHWTHGLRYSRHLLKLELRTLPGCNSPSYSYQTADTARRINISIVRIETELLQLREMCGDKAWADFNQKCAQTRGLILLSQQDAARERELKALKATRAYQAADLLGKALLGIKVGFGGQSAQQVAA